MNNLELIGASDEFITYLNEKVFTPLSDGESERFEVLGLRNEQGKLSRMSVNSVAVLAQFQVRDFIKNKAVTCNWITGERLGDVNSQGNTIKVSEKFKFSKTRRGGIDIGYDMADKAELRKLLLIHPQNKSNKGKPFHIKPARYLFHKFDPFASATKNADRISAKGTAIGAVENMSNTERMELLTELLGVKIVENMKPLQHKAKLLEIADISPEKIVGGTNTNKVSFSDFGALFQSAKDQEVLRSFRQDVFWFHDPEGSKPIFKGVAKEGSLDKQFTEHLKENPKLVSDIRNKVSLG